MSTMDTIDSGLTRLTRRVKREQGRMFVRTHLFRTPAPESVESRDTRPRELLLTALGWCTAGAVTSYAQRRGWDLGEVTVEMSHVDDDGVMRIGRLVQLGKQLEHEQREELARICEDTPVTRVVAEGARISTLVVAPIEASAPCAPELAPTADA